MEVNYIFFYIITNASFIVIEFHTSDKLDFKFCFEVRCVLHFPVIFNCKVGVGFHIYDSQNHFL